MKSAPLPLLLFMLPVPADAQVPDEAAGDAYRITLFHEWESKDDNGSSSNSSGGHQYVERILTVRPNGVERVYDLPLETDDDQRLINWYFPVRVFETNEGSIQILNRADLEQRRDEWLKAAEIPAEACGTWYFTWNAFQVECEPDAIIETIRALKIQPKDLAVGAAFEHPAALKPGQINTGSERSSYKVRMAVDPDYFHRGQAESDVIVGEIMREPISFEEAYEKRKTEQITGTIEVMFDTNPEGRVWRRTTLIESDKVKASGEVEHTVATETVERKPLDGI